MPGCENRILLRFADSAHRLPRRNIDAMCSSLGFWSLDPASGVLTCCPNASAILGISKDHPAKLGDVLLRLHAADRRRVLRAGLASFKLRDVFDVVVLMRVPGGARLLRVIGGLGYESGRRDAQIHGVIEQVAPAGAKS